MNANFRDGPNSGGTGFFGKSLRRTLKCGWLALLLVLAWIGQSFACCVSVEKYVSTNGLDGPFVKNSVTSGGTSVVPGVNNIPAATVDIPTANFGGPKVLYKFVITNCGQVDLHDVRLRDCIDPRSIGDNGFLVGDVNSCVWDPLLVPDPLSGQQSRTIASILPQGQSVTLTSDTFNLDPISYVDICGTFGRDRTEGIVRNNVVVEADADSNGDGTFDDKFVANDLNLVQCKQFQPIPAALGDRVWLDLNGNGIQDCQDTNNTGIIGDAGDTGAECNAGISGVTVNLVDCQTPSNILATTQTDANGFYLFQNLAAGQYCVKFNLGTVPAGTCGSGVPQFTTQKVGNDGALDSDANDITGIAPAVTLLSGETNRTVDAGVVCKECPLAIDKKCQVQVAPTENFVCSEAKPIDSLTMIWTGQNGIYIKAWKGTPGSTLLAIKGPINNGDRVTVTGMGGSPLDQVWELFSGYPDPQGTNKIGQSQFHISCSDVDMNGPEDCGKLEGNAKTTSTSLVNLWIFDGMAGNGHTLACTPTSQTGQDACSFVATQAASCQSLGVKPKTLAFRYTGNDCLASQNSQASDKWFCSGVPGTNPTISIVKDPTRITVTPTTGFKVGDLITVSAIGSDMGAEIQLQVGGQSLKIHTSCSQPLAVGDVFGSLELAQFNGQGAGADVKYTYEVKNTGNYPVDVTSVSDDKFGELLTQNKNLASGEAFILAKTALISQTTTNVVTAIANLAGTNTACGQARDQLTVTVTKPTCDLSMVFDTLSDDTATFKITNVSRTVATLDTFMLNFPASYGAIKEIRLDGSIFKSSATVPVVGSGVTIGSNGWTNPDMTKRQIDPGETRALQVIFTKKGAADGWVDITNLGGMTFKEGCQASFPSLPPCRFGRPTALIFQYTGQACSASNNDQAADKWSCSGDPAGVEPVQVVMMKDASLLAVALKSDVNGNGKIDVGDTFEIRRIDGSEFATETLFNIVSGSTLLQSLKIHTSCSQPLNVGDQFGSVILKGFEQRP